MKNHILLNTGLHGYYQNTTSRAVALNNHGDGSYGAKY